MAIVTTDNKHYTDIAEAIRSKNGSTTKYKPEEMAAAIGAIETETELNLEDIHIEPTDEEQIVHPSTGYDGIGSVTVGATNIPNTVAIDYSNYSSGTFIETLDTGEELEYTLTLDSKGKPISIATPSGDTVTVEWQV